MILFKRVLFIIFIISGTFLPCAFFTHVMTVQEKIGQGTEVYVHAMENFSLFSEIWQVRSCPCEVFNI